MYKKEQDLTTKDINFDRYSSYLHIHTYSPQVQLL